MIRKIAWRNVWRNRRRSLITMASIFFAVFFAIAMRAMQLGTYDRMIDNVVNSFYGYIQVHEAGYWDDQVIDNAMTIGDLPERIMKSVDGVVGVYPRVESFVLAATDDKTRGAMVVGLDPEAESDMLELSEKLVSGSMFGPQDESVLIGDGLAKSLDLQVADTLVLLGQGYHGVTAAGKYPVAGILKFPVPTMNTGMLIMPFTAGQRLLNAQDLATTLVVSLEDGDDLDDVQSAITAITDTTQHEVMTWREIMPELVQAIQADNASGLIMIAILYVVVTFGIFGTLLMMMNERRFEFGVLLAVGMSRGRLILMTLLELSWLAILGGIAGALVVYPVQVYFNRNPIEFTGQVAAATEQIGWEPVLPASIDVGISLAHTTGVLLVTLVISLYAVFKLLRLEPVEAMRL